MIYETYDKTDWVQLTQSLIVLAGAAAAGQNYTLVKGVIRVCGDEKTVVYNSNHA
jgi:hypothetical protein